MVMGATVCWFYQVLSRGIRLVYEPKGQSLMLQVTIEIKRKFLWEFNFRFFAVDKLSSIADCKRLFPYFAMSSAQINDFQKSKFAHILFCGFVYAEPGH